MCLCDLLYFKSDEWKLKRYYINKSCGEKRCKYYALSYFNFKVLNFKVNRKWRETHLVAYKLKTGWGKWNYIDVNIGSCSELETSIISSLTLHNAHTTTEAISLILKTKKLILQKNCCLMNSNFVCVWESIFRRAFTHF